MENSLMFVIGILIFIGYLSGYLLMVHKQNDIQKKNGEDLNK